ncbi:hypothetical protein DFS30_03505 [Akkermansia muciniphila]|nr:hypothetical protein CUC06_03445 [Akkermansia muciniphila]MBE5696429.1 hypothetical protein [Akkermansia sp.]PNC62117.1 hypothetical protein CXU07_07300 [Akkermansia muciniphila]PNC72890.1 hypothetical protein CXU04_05710 [Akkermansia muciniphila]PNC77538.1 hypothetical protein CXT98_10765 [Akkermansia muciniphila]
MRRSYMASGKGKASFSSGTEDDDGKDGNDCQNDNDGGNITFLWTSRAHSLLRGENSSPAA